MRLHHVASEHHIIFFETEHFHTFSHLLEIVLFFVLLVQEQCSLSTECNIGIFKKIMFSVLEIGMT